ncbi:hypothetical protein [Limosilactobacillus fermentum]
MKSLWQRADRRLWVLSILIGFVVTWLVNIVPFINRVERFAVFSCSGTGPLQFGLGSPFKTGAGVGKPCLPGQFSAGGPPVGPKYSLYFAPAYLAVAYLAWSIVRANPNK